jgi:hypothetical protein
VFLVWLSEQTAIFGFLVYTLLTGSFRTTEVETELCSSWMLCRVQRQFLTDVSGKPIGLIFDFSTSEYGTDRLSQNGGKELALHAA